MQKPQREDPRQAFQSTKDLSVAIHINPFKL